MRRSILNLFIAVCIIGFTSNSYAATPSKIFSTTVAGKAVMCGVFGSKTLSGTVKGSTFTTEASNVAALLKKANALKKKGGSAYKAAKAKYAAALSKQKKNDAGCSAASPPPSGGNAASGQATFNSKCAGCHVAATKAGRSASQIQTSLSRPEMLGVSASSTEIANLVAYLATQ